MADKLDYPETWLEPPRGRVVVIAPHPDDETIGCGGTLALHRRRGDDVHLVVVTDGDAGDPDGRFPREDYVQRRRGECARAAATLGVAAPVFLGFGDQRVEAGALHATLGAVVEGLHPEVIYHPGAIEMHVDHHVVGRVVGELACELSTQPRTFAYEIWVPVVPTHVIDVSSVWDVKQDALACYASQLVYNDYRRATAGLNAYRAIFLPQASYVEAFAETTPQGAGRRAQ